MKKSIQFFPMLLLAIALIMASCSSPEHLLKNGEYDESVVEAIRKLRKKKKKRKHVEIVEEAFRKVTRADMDAVASLKAEGRASNWVKINKIHKDIKDRQELIAPHLPLYAKDGYKAEFRFVNINPMERESRENAAEYFYVSGKEHLEKGERGQKYAARRAYSTLENTYRYFDNYKDVKTLQERAIDLGQTYVLFDVKNTSNTILPRDFEAELLSFDIKSMDNRWTKYHTNSSAREAFDYAILLKVNDIFISPEQVTERRYIDQKEIKDGFDYVLDNNGNVLKDSLGNDIKTDRYVQIQAWVDEVKQHKAATLQSRVVLRDMQTQEILRNENLQVTAIFDHCAATYQGDRRALSSDSKRRLGNTPLPFPSNEALIFDALDNLKPVIKTEIDFCEDIVMR